MTLACNRSNQLGAPTWFIYTKCIGITPLRHTRFVHNGLGHVNSDRDDDGMVFRVTLSNFSSSIDEYFVICALIQSDTDIHNIVFPMQPYIITIIGDTTTATTIATTTATTSTADMYTIGETTADTNTTATTAATTATVATTVTVAATAATSTTADEATVKTDHGVISPDSCSCVISALLVIGVVPIIIVVLVIIAVLLVVMLTHHYNKKPHTPPPNHTTHYSNSFQCQALLHSTPPLEMADKCVTENGYETMTPPQ